MRALWREETESRKTWIAARLKEGLAKSGNPDPKGIPEGLAAVGAEAFADLRPGTRQTWALPAQKGERPLPPVFAEAGRGMVAAFVKRADAARRRGVDVPDWGAWLAKPMARFVLAARRGLSSDEVGVAFAVQGPKGERLIDARQRIQPLAAAPDAALVTRMPENAVPFSEGVRGWAAVMAERGQPGPATLAALLHPGRSEPLALAVGPTLDETARALGTGVVACLPDAAYGESGAEAVSRNISKGLPQALAAAGMAARLDGDTLVVRLANRASGSELRADRSLLRRRIADVEREGHLNYRYSEPWGLERAYLTALPVNLYQELYVWEWPWALPLAWNALSAAQQFRAANGGLPLREAPELASRLALAWGQAFGPSNLVGAEEQIPPTLDFARWTREGVLRARVGEFPTAVVLRGGMAFPNTIGEAALGGVLSEGQPGSMYRAPGARFYPGTRQEVTMGFELGGKPGTGQGQPFSIYRRTGDVPRSFSAVAGALGIKG